jgi:hypothetical protein
MREGDESTPAGEFRAEPIEIEPSLGCHRQKSQYDAASLGKLLPGHEVAVMLKVGQQDLIAGRQKCAKGIGQQVDR